MSHDFEVFMKKLSLLVTLMSLMSIANAQDSISFSSQQWHAISAKNNIELIQLNSRVKNKKSFLIDIHLLEQSLQSNSPVKVDLPLPNGKFVTFKLSPTAVMSEELAEKYPSIKTFSGHQVDNPKHIGRFDITPHGFHGVFNFEKEKVNIEPTTRDNNKLYQSYFQKDAQPLTVNASGNRLNPRRNATLLSRAKRAVATESNAINTDLTTYKIAIATTGEYSEFHGGTKEKVLAAMVTLVNRINEVYSRDLAIQFELVANNDAIIFLDAESDPFENTDQDIDLLNNVINNAIGAENYDIGHLVGTGGGGLASFAVVCSSFKAEGVTGSDRPTGDAFYIDYVAHEIGHQFGADHTFNGSQGACDGNREDFSAYEPGSASTIMGYAGICGSQNLQNSSEPYFHIHSIDQINAFKNQISCGIKAQLNNTMPTVSAGSDYTIPARTPFTLTGSATDVENDSLTYSWEQHDLGGVTNSPIDDKTDDGNRPLFRVFEPKSTAVRTFPSMENILAERQVHGEALPTKSRELNFRLVVRDNQGNVADDATLINVVANEQGFSVNDTSNWNSEKQLITWHTATTEQAPVSCSQVNILLSTDSGNSFNHTLVNGTDNDGSEEVSTPEISTEKARIKIACANNIFFAVNNLDFQINNITNTQPIANDDETSLIVGQSIVIDILANDTDADNDELSITDTVYSGLGTVSISDNKLSYTPATDFIGSETVIYTISDGQGGSASATVSINVTNTIPVAINDQINLEQGQTTTIDVLANDSDADNHALLIESFDYSGNGNIAIVDNKLSYTPASTFVGSESLTYTISDNHTGQATATVTITVNVKPVIEPAKSSSGGTVYYLLLLMCMVLKAKTFKRKYL